MAEFQASFVEKKISEFPAVCPAGIFWESCRVSGT